MQVDPNEVRGLLAPGNPHPTAHPTNPKTDGVFQSLKDYCRHADAPATVIAAAVGGAEPLSRKASLNCGDSCACSIAVSRIMTQFFIFLSSR